MYIFDYEMTDPESFFLAQGEKLFQILTYNPMDSLYFVDKGGRDEIEQRDEIRRALIRKYGKLGVTMAFDVEDVTYMTEGV